MKLLHWNIHMWTDAAGHDNRDAVRELIRQESPDVVSLVEVDEPLTGPSTLAQLAEELGYAWVFVPAFEYRGVRGFGNALLVGGDVRAVQQWQLLSPRVYDGSEPSEQRTLVAARIRLNDRSTWVGATHLPRGDVTMRAEASARLVGLLPQLGSSWLLCGDFNQPPATWLPDGTMVAPEPALPTYPTNDPTEAIDYCVASGMSATGRVLSSTASDHLPLTVSVDT